MQKQGQLRAGEEEGAMMSEHTEVCMFFLFYILSV